MPHLSCGRRGRARCLLSVPSRTAQEGSVPEDGGAIFELLVSQPCRRPQNNARLCRCARCRQSPLASAPSACAAARPQAGQFLSFDGSRFDAPGIQRHRGPPTGRASKRRELHHGYQRHFQAPDSTISTRSPGVPIPIRAFGPASVPPGPMPTARASTSSSTSSRSPATSSCASRTKTPAKETPNDPPHALPA